MPVTRMYIPEIYKSLMLGKMQINIEIITSNHHMLNVTDYVQGVNS